MRGQELSVGMSSLPVLVSLQDAELAGFSFTAGLFVHEFGSQPVKLLTST